MGIALQSGQIHRNGNTAGVTRYARSPWVACPCHPDGPAGQVVEGEEWSREVVGMVLLVGQTTGVRWVEGEVEVSRL